MTTLTIFCAALTRPQVIHAQQYGQEAEVLGAQAPEIVHEPIPAALGDFNFLALGLGLLLASAVLFYLSKRMQSRSRSIIN